MSKIQYNVETAKNFRIALSEYHDAQHTLNDYVCAKSDRVKGLCTLRDSNNAELAKLDANEKGVMRSRDEIESELSEVLAKIEAESKALSDYREEQAKRFAKAEALVSKSLWESAMTDEFDEKFAEFFRTNGLPDATAKNVPTLYFGMKKNGAKAAYKTGELMGKQSFNQWRTMFLCTLCDTLVDAKAISAYKYNYVKPEKSAK